MDRYQVMLATAQRDLVEYEDLLNRLQSLNHHSGPRETLVELGAGVWANARIPDLEPVTIEIGLGICLEMTIEESTQFTKAKISSLQKRIQKLGGH